MRIGADWGIVDREGRRDFWVWEIGFVVVFGVPIYWSGLATVGFVVSFLIHLGLVVVYALLLVGFGRDSNIEVGTRLLFIAVVVAVLFPVFQRARLNQLRHQHHIGAVGLARGASIKPTSRGASN